MHFLQEIERFHVEIVRVFIEPLSTRREKKSSDGDFRYAGHARGHEGRAAASKR